MSVLFGVISPARRKPEQVARRADGEEVSTYTLLRDPFSLDELNEYGSCMAIWRENETLTYVVPRDSDDRPLLTSGKRYLSLNFGGTGPSIKVFGEKEDAVAETVAYFMRLESPSQESRGIEICSYGRNYNLRAAGTRWLAHMLDVDPSREVEFEEITRSAEQCTVLVTRSHPLRLTFWECMFEDGGTALVDALERRESSFGALNFQSTVLDDDNMRRLLRVNTIGHLGLSLLDDTELALLVFSAPVDSLEYDIYLSSLSEADFQRLNITTKKLTLNMHHEGETFPTETVVAFYRRVAEIGHFVELGGELNLDAAAAGKVVPEIIEEEQFRAVLANSNLQVLDLSGCELDWGLHLGRLFEDYKDHKDLHTIKLSVSDEVRVFGPQFSILRQLLSQNRNITFKLTENDGTVYSDGDLVHTLYALNRFYRGSASLLIDPPPERPSLVTTALEESAANDFQRSALLLSNHTEVLCELVQFAQLDELM